MSNGRKRAAAFGAGADRAADRVHLDAPRPPSGGNWAKSAVEAMGEELDSTRDRIYRGIIEGSLPVVVPAESIDDPLGSDRLSVEDEDPEDASSLQSLIENIRRRGLRTPLRVRPADPSWKPDRKNPQAVLDQRFILQSGRRRLAACRELGIDPLVFLSFVEGDNARLEDLQERFFENAARRDLTTFEKLLSVGMIAEELPGATLQQIAEIVGLSAPTVSRGAALLKHRGELEQQMDVRTASLRQITEALAQLRATNASPSPEAVRKRQARERQRAETGALPFRRRTIGASELRLGSARDGGLTLTLKSKELGPEAMTRIAEFIENLVSKPE